MKHYKLSTDVTKDQMEIIDRALKIEQRSRANFVRLCCLSKSKGIIEEHKLKEENKH